MSQDKPKARLQWWWVPGLLFVGVVGFLAARGTPDLSRTEPASAQVLLPPDASSSFNATLEPTFQTNRPEPSPTPQPTATQTPTRIPPSPAPPAVIVLSPVARLIAEEWKDWPVIPIVSENARQIYQRGLRSGNDPHAFSVLGDCQSLPETFMGVYDTDPTIIHELPAPLQETARQFQGSFSRMGPTLKAGTTSAAVLWYAWHEGKYGCGANESPLDCEIRLSKPSIAIINLGTHYETRNIEYLRKILDQLIEKGILPVLSTKADNRELDERLNLEMAQLAFEYDIPMWNFYSAVNHLPDNGVSIKAGEEHLGVIYLTPEALEIHYFTALQALDAVWRAVR